MLCICPTWTRQSIENAVRLNSADLRDMVQRCTDLGSERNEDGVTHVGSLEPAHCSSDWCMSGERSMSAVPDQFSPSTKTGTQDEREVDQMGVALPQTGDASKDQPTGYAYGLAQRRDWLASDLRNSQTPLLCKQPRGCSPGCKALLRSGERVRRLLPAGSGRTTIRAKAVERPLDHVDPATCRGRGELELLLWSRDLRSLLHRSDLLQELLQCCAALRVQREIYRGGLLPNIIKHRVCDAAAREVVPFPIAVTSIEKILEVALDISRCQVNRKLELKNGCKEPDRKNDRNCCPGAKDVWQLPKLRALAISNH